MTDDQKIYQHIGKALWSIMPENASSIYCIGMIYPDTYQIGPEWIDSNGLVQCFDFDNYPNEFCDKIYCLTQKLQRLPPFDREPWTHFKATLTEAGKFKMDFAYIPEDDSWSGLFMKRVSELSLEEVEEKYIPEEEWKKCVDKYGS
ncbi:immunity protein YezG family protein [Vibrio gazogenes]|uniref:DUF600 domain-containing protein n=1 Tax=Vibrio gazogenes TaxID=687 RepID=A0A1Z2SL89_VIBGA|nr:immunity protein YezG family protein [Vibrio gazogenes]ASA57875.1 hypothetical protein BSQ33_19335 [Vibrio gazogenes]ASA57905.1 hypothetical protein BSQ33_19540 [Vibrio gazogenes]